MTSAGRLLKPAIVLAQECHNRICPTFDRMGFVDIDTTKADPWHIARPFCIALVTVGVGVRPFLHPLLLKLDLRERLLILTREDEPR
jgi:hypothetical protein